MRKAFLGILIMACAIGTHGQDPHKVGPTIYRQKLANERTRVFEITFKPGQSIGMHAHPDHVVYILTKGTLMITEEGKKPITMKGKPGDTFFLPAQKHSAKNVGKTTMKAVVVEFR
jgi:beta-alanine degradation protein BauB